MFQPVDYLLLSQYTFVLSELFNAKHLIYDLGWKVGRGRTCPILGDYSLGMPNYIEFDGFDALDKYIIDKQGISILGRINNPNTPPKGRHTFDIEEDVKGKPLMVSPSSFNSEDNRTSI